MRGVKAKRIRKKALTLSDVHTAMIDQAWASRPWYWKAWHFVRKLKKPEPISYRSAIKLLKSTTKKGKSV